ncbi:MAG: hypothetical protein AB7S83_05830 [Candidatus Methanomethylophilaceae archaeon]
MIDGGAIGKTERVAICILSAISLPLTVSATAYFLCAADLPAAASSILEGMVIGLALADAMCAVAILDTVGRKLLIEKGNQT